MRAALVALALVACEADGAPRTNELVATFTIDQPDETGPTHYEATFSVGGRYRKLDDGDEVRVTADVMPPAILVSDANVLGPTYRLDRDDAPFTSATFVLTRPTSGNGAPRSVTPFPPVMTDFVPASGTTFAYGDGSAGVTMAWSNELEGALITFASHACDRSDNHVPSKPLPDKGAIVLPLKDLVIVGKPTGPTCLLLEVRRGLRGTLDPALTAPGSTVTGHIVHTAKVTVTP